MKVKLVTNKIKQTDPLAEKYPCIVTIHNTHNHSLHLADALRELKLLDATKSDLFGLFESGCTPAEAIRMNESKLLATQGLSALADNGMNSNHRSGYYLWDLWRRSFCGSFTGKGMYDAINQFAAKVPDCKIKLKVIDDSTYVCVVVTDLMMRVHGMKQAGDVAFVDSTSHIGELLLGA